MSMISLNPIFKISRINAKVPATPLVAIIEGLFTVTPYTNHKTCVQKTVITQRSEISFVDFVIYDLTIYGSMDNEVNTHATNPSISIYSTIKFY